MTTESNDLPLTESIGQRKLDQLREKKREAAAPGSERAITAQAERGKMSARERIAYLLDDDSFEELDALVRHRTHGVGLDGSRPYTDGVVCGFGSIDGRRVCIYSQDFTVFGGSLGEAHAEKIHKI